MAIYCRVLMNCHLVINCQGKDMGKKSSKALAARERQIMDILFELGEASVAEVRARMSDAPSYSSVRTMIRLLESKGYVKQSDRVGTKYVYKPTQSKSAASRSALQRVLKTFFRGSAPDAVAAILSAEKLSSEDLQRIEQLIEDARKEGR